MNVMGEMFKDVKKRVTIESNLCLLLEVVCSFGVHNNMCVENAREKEVQRSEHKQR
jgi:hypothetical protein